ncbi:aminodeoxychorismate synthase component I [Methylomonas sp. CM2]|uniref:aminodeoxychorismate synthase component I n=1 Tax=Methylomonas sp. CM2 TaxID=3417647 RepID=UPI003CF8D6D5
MPPIQPVKIRLPYVSDSAALFAPWADRPWAMFLDSGRPADSQGRFDILAAEPEATLQTFGELTRISRGGEIRYSADDPFDLLKVELGEHQPGIEGLPFCGGAIGYIGYDLARRIERLPAAAWDCENLPELAVGIYRWAVVVDHESQASWLTGYGLSDVEILDLTVRFSRMPEPEPETGFEILSEPRSNMTASDYAQALAKIKHYLKEGDCYQINLAQRFESTCRGRPWIAYRALRQINPAPFSAYLNTPDAQVLSSSPERFLRVNGGCVETKPIKGTRPRGHDADEDRARMAELLNSPKDRAENVMIVDLLRNDLGKSCQKGSVSVPTLFEIESYATVHHLVSTVTGRLAEDQQAIDLLRSCFPGGSITGAPKVRAMEIIEELEPHRRGVYCGAIGYIGFNGDMDTNIAIRTLVHNRDTIRFWAGGGIVNDSRMEEEYQECFDKAAALLKVLEKFRR